MKTISTAAYAAVAATTSKGRFVVATDIIEIKAHMNPVMIPSLTVLVEVNSNHHIGAKSMTSPITMILVVVKLSNFSSLEYTVVADLMWTSGTSLARNTFQRCRLWHASIHCPSGGRLREVIEIKSPFFSMNEASSLLMAFRSSQCTTFSIWRSSARGRVRTLEKASINWSVSP